MHTHISRALIAGAALALSGFGSASAQTATPRTLLAQASPLAKPMASPSPLTLGGYVRSFAFTRLNDPQYTTKNPLNQASWNTGVSLHATYRFSDSLSVAGRYLYADPLAGSCSTAASHATGSPCVRKNTGAMLQGTNPDDTLPGFRLSALYEAYLQYKGPALSARLGDQIINTPWANASDSRLKPAAFQGIDVGYAFNKHWSGEAMYMDRFEGRVNSYFGKFTLLTATKIAGFGYGRLSYTGGRVAVNAHAYAFADIANALWLDGRYTWTSAGKPYVAIQAGAERSAGKRVIGIIDSQVLGVQAGVSPWKNVDLSVGYDDIPEKSDTLRLPAGVTCSASGAVGGSGTFAYFLPAGGTPQCRNNSDGTATVYYGGWASPYTDSYATDPLFTSSISQGMVDRRSAGQGVKLAAGVSLFEKRIRFVTSRAWYTYGNAGAGVAPTQEFDLDGTFFFGKVGPDSYRGFSLRHRYAERTQPFFTTNPDFKYNRTQLEYDF